MAGRFTWRALAAGLLSAAAAGAGCAVETTYDDVLPILEARCSSCHVDGISPYRPYFTDYESVASLERILRDTVTSREMPPFGMDNTALCGNNVFADEGLWLTDLELQTLTDWVDDGVPRGRDDLPVRPGYTELQLERVDRSVEMGEPYAFSGFAPESQHRCFVADPQVAEPALLSAFQVEPGNRFAVQSVALFALDDPLSQAAADELDAQDLEPGYPCFGGPRIDAARFVGTWVWGRSVVRFPEGTGIPLRPSSRLVVQVHYNSQGGSLHPAADRTRVDLELGEGAVEASYVSLSADGFSLRPGVKDAIARGFIQVEEPFRILGVAPLMHETGASLLVTRVRPFSETCLAEVKHWEFYNHLRLYQYLTPPPEVFAGDRLAIECRFETLSRIESTRQGEDASSEQCLARLYTVPADCAMNGTTAAALLLLPLTAACADAGHPPDDGGMSAPLTYWRDVHPILASRCHQCHLNGPSSYRPWFDGYEHVAEVAGSIAIATGSRDMPPWAVTADGSCGSWDRAHWLPDEEIRTLEAWASSDLIEGDVAEAESPDPIPAPMSLRRVDAVIDTGVEYRPALGDRLHRCFRARPRPSLDSAAYLTALQVLPGNLRAVQHVSLHALDTEEQEQAAAALEMQDAEPGYHCFDGSRVAGSRLLATWVWGEPTFRFPEGTGVRLEPGRDVVVQIHYNASGGSASPAPDRTRVELELAARAEEGRFVALEVPELALPPRAELAAASAFVQVQDSLLVHGVSPFMHSLGHSLSLLRAAGAECLAEVRHWHLYGHMRYHGYREPVRLDAGDRLWLECGYDTRSRSEPVRAGDRLEDEACRVHLYATSAAPGPGDGFGR